MAFTINTNIASMQAQEYLRTTSDFQAKTINKVTSGLRIINAGDDAAGLAIANSYRSDQAVLSQGVRNANDAMATLQTIDGGISNIAKLLDRAAADGRFRLVRWCRFLHGRGTVVLHQEASPATARAVPQPRRHAPAAPVESS